ncbi:MAG TPA: CoB--CoM heterodisulfide reductase iron-sulfur subunit B family protein [Candidatus Brocadiia bacterium]|nr:CoB--CoM heterodisulfide reductase iron-sulfur subunit B family protein [Candidatus Brocadiia bacterium]
MTYAYYPGCSLEGTAGDYNESTQAVCRALGVPLKEVPDWVCCGTTPAHETNQLLVTSLGVKNLASARSVSDKVVVPCAACYNRLKSANYEISHDKALKAKALNAAEVSYDGDAQVLHVIELLVREIGLEKLKAAVKKPLKGLAVASYYGCLLVRPERIMKFDDAEDPQTMDQVVAAVGGDVVDWPGKVDCCGASAAIPHTETVLKQVNQILTDAKACGADVVAVACPLCQNNLDLRQLDIRKKIGKDHNIPILYITQLVGLALGLSASELALQKLVVDATPVLKAKGVL